MAQLNKKIAAVCIAVVFCVIVSLLPQEREESAAALQETVAAAEQKEEAAATIKVYVSGAVHNPGLHDIAPDSRAVDAIAAAGGMTEEANKDRVNLAKICKDGMQINVPRLSAKELRRLRMERSVGTVSTESAVYVPAAAESSYASSADGTYSAAAGTESAAYGGVIHLNSASAAELEELPGVGEVTAQRIVEYRAQHGFSRIEDIMNVKGIGQAKFNKMRPYLAL